MSFYDGKLSKFGSKINQICKFLKFTEIPAENSVIPAGNSRRKFLGWQIPRNSRWPRMRHPKISNKMLTVDVMTVCTEQLFKSVRWNGCQIFIK